MPPKPSLAASLSVSTGKISSSSHWRANGIIAARAKARAVCCIARCSSLSSKSMVATDNGRAIGRQLTKGSRLMVDHIGHRCSNRLRRLVDVLHDCLHRIARNGIDLQLHLISFSEKAWILHRIHERFAQGGRTIHGNAWRSQKRPPHRLARKDQPEDSPLFVTLSKIHHQRNV